MLVPTTTINLDLDENLVALESVSIENSSLTNQVGATGVLNLLGQFSIATVLLGDVSGFLPNPPIAPPSPSARSP